ncbi:jerky protein homolog-like [Erpetoichthys calabaricus]|uniref:jerky protein homolog-like n=1 Tax=Erpetoichthys calabaricus TaxID=27687 RepID=UPI002233F821|nr:jerky protein homolog-like [Erpetoichthys calabaricus]
MASKRKHKSCTLKEKLEVLKRLHKGESATQLSKEFGVGKATISDWKKNRGKIEQFCTTTSEKTIEKRSKTTVSSYEKLDEALFLWFTQARQKGIPITGPLIQEKALQLNKLMDSDVSFTASCGFLDRWKKRHGIRQLTITGEKLSADNEAAVEYLEEFKCIISSYSPQQVYNADETGLNFKALPTKSLASQEERSAPGFKMDKQRLTVLACSNASATNKLPLMVIGKSAKPRCFKNMNMNSLPVFYRNQKKAWLDRALFKKWFDKQFVPKVKAFNKENGLPPRALLLIDNAPSHPEEMQLVCDDIKAIFLPPNVTSILQPMDQGVLQALKQNYRKMLLHSLLEDNEELTILDKLMKMNIKDVIYWVAEAWENTCKESLQKSWKNLWPELEFVQTVFPPTKENCELLQLVKRMPGCENAEEECVEEWTAVDDCGHEEYTDEDIVAAVQGTSADLDADDSEEEGDAPTDVVPHTAAASALDLALRYVEQHADATPTDVMFMRRWRNIASSSRFSLLRQKEITDFIS